LSLCFINFTFQYTTSGIALVLLVIRIFHIAIDSVCTLPNHSDTDGAITQSQEAINFLKSVLLNQLNICKLFTLMFFNSSNILLVLLDSIILKTTITFSSFNISGKAFIR